MTTKPKASTLPSYKFLVLSEVSGAGYLATSAGDITAKDTWSLKPGGIGPYNAYVQTAIAPQDATLSGQNANAGFAATGGNINITPGIGSVTNASGNVVVKDNSGSGGAWNTSHIVLGIYHIWVDSSGRLRIKNSTPTTDTDGTIVGTQS